MAGGVSSLNVSTAGAVVLYEAARQRRTSAAGISASHVQDSDAPGARPKKQKGLGS
jgi:23S rRNA (guanosine2251-2'-O)-methyltransferase